MSLSISTLSLFVFLVPGLIFRYSLYHQSIVKRAVLASNAIYSSILLVMFSLGIHLSALMLIFVTIKTVCLFGWANINISATADSNVLLTLGETSYKALEIPYLIYVAPIYFGATVGLSYFIAQFISALARSYSFFSRLLYGPFGLLFTSSRITVLTAFVLTNISYENRRVIYAGYAAEIGLKDGSKIDYMVLNFPHKFYLRLNQRLPTTSFEKSTPVSRDPTVPGSLFISGDEIENVHIEEWNID